GLRAEDQSHVVALFRRGQAGPAVVKQRLLSGVLARKERGELSEGAGQAVPGGQAHFLSEGSIAAVRSKNKKNFGFRSVFPSFVRLLRLSRGGLRSTVEGLRSEIRMKSLYLGT